MSRLFRTLLIAALLRASPAVAAPGGAPGAAAVSTAGAVDPVPVALLTDRDHELPTAPPGTLPSRGPGHAPVTLDLFAPVDAASARTVALVLRLAAERDDLRLVYHPLLQGGNLASRGAEVLWEARAQRRFWALCARLFEQPALVAPEREADLLAEAGRLGLQPERLAESLRTRRHRTELADLLRRERGYGVMYLEVWVNGQRLRGVINEVELRTEIDRQRGRAQALLRGGTSAADLYARLLRRSYEDRGDTVPPALLTLVEGAAAAEGPPRLAVQQDGSPSLGPQVAPVVVVLFGGLPRFGVRGLAQLALALRARHPQLRLIVKFLPEGQADSQTAWYLAQLSEGAPALFWRAFEALANDVGRSYYAGRGGIATVLRDLGIEVSESGLPPAGASVRPQGSRRWLRQSPMPGPALRRLERDRAEAQRLHVAGAALVINGILFRGSLSIEQIEPVVRRELERGLIERVVGAR